MIRVVCSVLGLTLIPRRSGEVVIEAVEGFVRRGWVAWKGYRNWFGSLCVRSFEEMWVTSVTYTREKTRGRSTTLQPKLPSGLEGWGCSRGSGEISGGTWRGDWSESESDDPERYWSARGNINALSLEEGGESRWIQLWSVGIWSSVFV